MNTAIEKIHKAALMLINTLKESPEKTLASIKTDVESAYVANALQGAANEIHAFLKEIRKPKTKDKTKPKGGFAPRS